IRSYIPRDSPDREKAIQVIREADGFEDGRCVGAHWMDGGANAQWSARQTRGDAGHDHVTQSVDVLSDAETMRADPPVLHKVLDASSGVRADPALAQPHDPLGGRPFGETLLERRLVAGTFEAFNRSELGIRAGTQEKPRVTCAVESLQRSPAERL